MVDTPSDSPGLSPHSSRNNGSKTNGSLWARLKSIFGANGDASLRESLGDVIEQHEGGSKEFSPSERSMLMRLLNFGDVRVEDVMVPRADIVSVDETITIVELLKIFASAGHSRLPVYRETLDDPTGLVHIKDLMNWIAKQGSAKKQRSAGAKSKTAKPTARAREIDLGRVNLDLPLSEANVSRQLLFVPPSMSAGDLLVKMQTSRIHMAVVVDEYGGTDGLVSIEDLVEEIVGEIEDEHDADEGPMIEPQGDDVYVADARASVEELDALLDTPLVVDERDEDADTLGGLVFNMAGRIPVRGELIRHDSGVEFEILDADARRIRRLKVRLKPSRPKAEPTE
jgi:CBS domain containing-hemolysin-like protein